MHNTEYHKIIQKCFLIFYISQLGYIMFPGQICINSFCIIIIYKKYVYKMLKKGKNVYFLTCLN